MNLIKFSNFFLFVCQSTRLSVVSDLNMDDVSLFQRSSSCKSTTVVGDTSSPYFLRILSMSNLAGILLRISVAVFSIN
jgi:hypothetical protein